MANLQKVQMRVSIASSDWSFQPGQVVMLDADQAKAWIRVGHAVAVNGTMPLTDFSGRDGLADLDAEECLRRRCVCGRRAAGVVNNTPYCLAHFKAAQEAGR